MSGWGRRYSGVRNSAVMAGELLADPDLKDAITLAAGLAPEQIAVIGHSFTMQVHWSTPGPFTAIADEMMKSVNPKVQFKYFQEGGMNAVTARAVFFEDALAWHPDLVLFAIMNEGAGNREALKTMIEGFTRAPARCLIFDSLWPAKWDRRPKRSDPVLAPLPLEIIEVRKLLSASPAKNKFFCLDKIHMTESWHMLMAREWFKYLAGARKERLA